MTTFTPEQIDEAITCIEGLEVSKHFKVRAWRQQILGEVVCIQIVSPYEVTRHNANLLIDLMVHVNYQNPDTFNIEKSIAPKAAKYRMIKGKTPLAAAEKLVAWVRKNVDNLNSIAVGKEWLS